jgi:hypothetical protein
LGRHLLAAGASTFGVVLFCLFATSMSAKSPIGDAQGLYAMDAEDIDGNTVDLSKFMGKVSLVVNVASN